MGITLWLVPSAQDTLKIKEIMGAGTQGNKSSDEVSYPKFMPHITLAALPSPNTIPLSDIRSSIPASQSLLPISFKSIEVGDHFFRSVFITIQLTSALSTLHQRVHSALGIEPRTPRFPHISLCYISDGDASIGERDRFLHKLEDEGRVRRGDDGIALNHGHPVADDYWISGFDSPEVWIADCDGPVESWTILDKVVFNQ